MTDLKKQLEELTIQLEELKSRQKNLSKDLFDTQLKLEAARSALSRSIPFETNIDTTPIPETILIEEPDIAAERLYVPEAHNQKSKSAFHVNKEMEDFIGTNVISKIGILITIIGVFIGAKYAIDKELISPAMRVLSGYLAAFILIFIALRLRQKYQYFSSIIMGGGLAVTYFMTYIAYSFYGMFLLWLVFAFMVVTTVATVGIALWYNQKVIALIGQVAAYAIPFLLGDKNGNVVGLFAYISCINLGLLAISFKKDWKVLYHIAFFLTWLIYYSWLIAIDPAPDKFVTGITFLTINFITFYLTFLAYKVFKKELYKTGKIGILLLNALFYFLLGYYLISATFINTRYLTWFTVLNAGIHFTAGYLIYRLKLVDETVFQFVLGLGLLFLTIAIPIELNGNWVTLLWAVEATILFYVAQKNRRPLYLDIALPLVIVALLSLFHDWNAAYFNPSANLSYIEKSTPFLNFNFALSLFVYLCIAYVSFNAIKGLPERTKDLTVNFFQNFVPVIFLCILYLTLYYEIQFSWDQGLEDINQKSNKVLPNNNNNSLYRSLSLFIYSCLYCGSWLLISTRWIRKESLYHLLVVFGLIIQAIFLFSVLLELGQLRENYVTTPGASKWIVLIRYLCFASLAFLWYAAKKSIEAFKSSYKFQTTFSALFNITLLSVISNEFIHWMDMGGYKNQYKLGLSLICGAYALVLLFIGFMQKKKYLRISAIVLFGVTILKLFFYDLSSLSTISKTIVLVLLGVLLLLASFLYNKYKDLLPGEEEIQKR